MLADIIVASSFFLPPTSLAISVFKPQYKTVSIFLFPVLLVVIMTLGIEPDHYKAEEGNMFYKIVLILALVNVLDAIRDKYKIPYNILLTVAVLMSTVSAFVGVVQFIYIIIGH
jgi:hypothetical protein